MTRRRGILAFLASGIAGVEFATLLFGSVIAYAAGLSNVSPNPGSSNPDGAHVFFLRVAQYAGVQRDVKLATYYVDQPNGSSIQISPGTGSMNEWVCKVSDQTSGYDTNRYITVTIENPINGNKKEYHISRARACDLKSGGDGYNEESENSLNAFYGRYRVPNSGEKDNQTQLYKLKVTVALNDNLDKPESDETFRQRFIVRITDSSDPNPRVAPLGGDGRNFSLVTDWDKEDPTEHPPRSRSIKIPFGLPCTASGNKEAWVGIYDADNENTGGFVPLKVSFQVQYFDEEEGYWRDAGMIEGGSGTNRSPQTTGDVADGSVVKRDGVGGDVEDVKFDTYVVPDGSAADVRLAKVRVNLEPKTQYRVIYYEIAPKNTVDVVVPEDSIFGDISCGWRMAVRSTVDNQQGTIEGTVGQKVTFKHTAKNVGVFESNDVTTRVFRSNATSGIQAGPHTQKYQPDEVWPYENDFTPTAADVGKTFCQYIRATPHSSKDPAHIDSSPPACVHVNPPLPPSTHVVNIQPVADNGPDIEPTEYTTINGRVIVSGFPAYTDWGYNEYSVRGTPQREPVRPWGWLETDTETISANASYWCPHASDTQSGTTCIHAYNGAGNDTKKECEDNGHNWSGGSCTDTHPASVSYSCPTGYSGSGPTCSRTRYRCNESPTWGAWGAAAPSCPIQYACDSGASRDNSTNPPRCNAWKCPYQNSYVPGTSTPPTCEYRCNAGSGPVAHMGSGSYSSPCYQQPSFSMNCVWDTGLVIPVNVTGNGSYCVSSVQKQGMIIGVNACAVLTHTKPLGWSPSNPRPGYGRNASGTYTQMKEFGWGAPTSDSGCSRVVGKPTVKVFGGDVVAGNAFANGSICSPVSTGSIAGWPRSNSNNYDAAYTQLAAYAPGSITGFPTAKVSTNTNTRPPRSLAFANFPASVGDRYGGGYNKSFCAHDHYGSRSASMSSINLSTLNAIGQPSGSFDAGSAAPHRINNSPIIPNGKQIVVYARGNVFIGGSGIRYNRTGWISTQDIPGFKLVVSGGNIYIENTVTQLDGIYIAQPDSTGTGGEIYTCASSTGAMSNSSIYSNCQIPLTVNGAFVAKKVHLLRTQGTAILGGTAERFNYLPEIWTAKWPRNTSSTDQLKYDAVISLPPVL